MAKYGSNSFSVLLVDGYDLLASKVKSFRHKVEALMTRSDGLGDSSEASSPTGLSRVELAQDGAFFDDSAAGAHALLSVAANQRVSRTLVAAWAGNAIGRPFIGVSGVYGMGYEVLGQNEDLTKANVDYSASGAVEKGVILQNWATKTVDWNTKTDGAQVDFTLDTGQRVIPITSNSVANPSVVTTPIAHGLTTGQKVLISGVTGSTPTINGERTVTVIDDTHFSVPVNVTVGGTGGSFVRANTVGGGAGYLEVSALAGLTGFVGKIRSSPDDITYADLITFANVTAAPAAERIAVAGTVDRYLSFNGDVTGTGSITLFAGFGRN